MKVYSLVYVQSTDCSQKMIWVLLVFWVGMTSTQNVQTSIITWLHVSWIPHSPH